MTEDPPQMKAVLRQNPAARAVRQKYGKPGTRVTTGQMDGTVKRHIPHSNAQGGVLVVEWDNGHTGRIGPMSIEVVPPFESSLPDADELYERYPDWGWPEAGAR